MVVAGIELLAANEFTRRRWHVEEGRFAQAAVGYLQLFEPWSMFAPDAPTADTNLYVDAVTREGRHVDPFNEVANPRYPAPGPHIPARLEQNAFFCYYVLRIVGRRDYHQAFTEWILRYPERTGHWEDEIVSFEAFIVQQTSPPPGEREPRDLRATSFLVWPPRPRFISPI